MREEECVADGKTTCKVERHGEPSRHKRHDRNVVTWHRAACSSASSDNDFSSTQMYAGLATSERKIDTLGIGLLFSGGSSRTLKLSSFPVILFTSVLTYPSLVKSVNLICELFIFITKLTEAILKKNYSLLRLFEGFRSLRYLDEVSR